MGQETTQIKMDRSLNLFDATAIVAGAMIGSGIFIVSSDIAKQVNNAWIMLAVWLIAGIMTLIGALSYGEFAASIPEAGGQYVYLRKAWGELMGFLYGWTFFLVINTGSIAAVSIAFAKFVGILVPAISASVVLAHFGPIILTTQNLTAMILMVFLSFINSRGVKLGAFIQNIFTVSNIIALSGVILLGLILCHKFNVIHANFGHFAQPEHGLTVFAALAMGLVGSFFAFDGWNSLTFVAGEIKNPQKNLPLALLFGTGTVILLYFLTNVVYLSVLPVEAIKTAKDGIVGAIYMEKVLGTFGKEIISLIIAVAAFGCVNSMILAGPRVFYAMAKDGLFFKKMAELGKKSHVPENAIYFQCIWALVLALSGSFNALLNYIVFAALLFYVLTISGLFPFRIKFPNIERPYKAIGYPILPAIYCLIALYVSINLLLNQPECTWPGLVIVMTGVPVYYFWKYLAKRTPAELTEETEELA